MATEQEIFEVLSQIQDPDLHKDIVSLGFVKNLKILGKMVSFDINLTTPACPVKDSMQSDAKRLVSQLPGVDNVVVNMTSEVRRTLNAIDKTAIKDVKNFVAIGSGKGGVGKSTVAVNIAVAMAQTGAKVGLLDGDIYGPSIRMMMGTGADIKQGYNETIIPAEAHGIKFMSMGFMVQGDKPLIWRGPMAHKALQQCIFQVMWGDLDYLFVDLPPGTGDVHLTLVQSVGVTGAVLVSTPQDVGLTISMKTFRMFETANVRTLGLIENMSYYVCSHCGTRQEIFGHGGSVAKTAEKLGIPFLGAIPLDPKICEQSDAGQPIVLSGNKSPVAQAYKTIVEQLAAKISIASFEAPKIQIVEEPV